MRPFRVLAILLATASNAAPAFAQEVSESLPSRRVGGMAGLGNTFGGIGGSLELFLAHGRISVLAGLGGVPNGGMAAAAALRGHTGGSQHQVFLEAALSPLAVSDAVGLSDGQTWYGPALSAGYRYTSREGVSFLAGGGAGWAASIEEFEPVLNVGIGYTWRGS
jgi:hypothetical protein